MSETDWNKAFIQEIKGVGHRKEYAVEVPLTTPPLLGILEVDFQDFPWGSRDKLTFPIMAEGKFSKFKLHASAHNRQILGQETTATLGQLLGTEFGKWRGSYDYSSQGGTDDVRNSDYELHLSAREWFKDTDPNQPEISARRIAETFAISIIPLATWQEASS